ncbi:hypothetical protein [Acidithiobacillus ferrooxidans]|jgi:hypothetical protein|nr:hypothetical protein [Acidithiobacillus ferrooxidans]
MNGNIMGLSGVTILAVIGTAIVAVDRWRKKRKKRNGKSSSD